MKDFLSVASLDFYPAIRIRSKISGMDEHLTVVKLYVSIGTSPVYSPYCNKDGSNWYNSHF